jgi:hypothetical protein
VVPFSSHVQQPLQPHIILVCSSSGVLVGVGIVALLCVTSCTLRRHWQRRPKRVTPLDSAKPYCDSSTSHPRGTYKLHEIGRPSPGLRHPVLMEGESAIIANLGSCASVRPEKVADAAGLRLTASPAPMTRLQCLSSLQRAVDAPRDPQVCFARNVFHPVHL